MIGYYARNDHEVRAIQFAEGNRRDVLDFLESMGNVLWIRYSLADEFDVVGQDDVGEVIRTFKDCYLVIDGASVTVMSKDDFESMYYPVDRMIGPAPLADKSYGEYDVAGDFPAALKEGVAYNLELVTSIPIRSHQNGNGVDGYWCGFYCLAPEGYDKFQYRKDVGDNVSVLEGRDWIELPVEQNVDGEGRNGVAFYFDKAVLGDKMAYVQLRFGDEPEAKAYTFSVDFSMVETE